MGWKTGGYLEGVDERSQADLGRTLSRWMTEFDC